MGTRRTEARLRKVGAEIRKLRAELEVIGEQLVHMDDDAHAEAMQGHRAHVIRRIAELEVRQDQLLDSM